MTTNEENENIEHLLKPHDHQIDEILNQCTDKELSENEAHWKESVASRWKSIRRLKWRRRLYLLLGKGRARTTSGVSLGYNNMYDQPDYAIRRDKTLPCEWRERRFFSRGPGVTRVHQLMHINTINALSSRNVLEIGSGSGYQLVNLAAQFPDTSFTGLELTAQGIANTAAACNNPTLPDVYSEFAACPPVNITAHRQVRLIQGDACTLPFKPGSFDLVYTSLALEQMQHIWKDVMKNIQWLEPNYVAFCEPFRDANKNGFKRDYIQAKEYFSAWIQDIEAFGFEPIYVNLDMPNKAYLGIAYVVAKFKG